MSLVFMIVGIDSEMKFESLNQRLKILQQPRVLSLGTSMSRYAGLGRNFYIVGNCMGGGRIYKSLSIFLYCTKELEIFKISLKTSIETSKSLNL